MALFFRIFLVELILTLLILSLSEFPIKSCLRLG